MDEIKAGDRFEGIISGTIYTVGEYVPGRGYEYTALHAGGDVSQGVSESFKSFPSNYRRLPPAVTVMERYPVNAGTREAMDYNTRLWKDMKSAMVPRPEPFARPGHTPEDRWAEHMRQEEQIAQTMLTVDRGSKWSLGRDRQDAARFQGRWEPSTSGMAGMVGGVRRR